MHTQATLHPHNCKRGGDNPKDGQHQNCQKLRQLLWVQMLQWKFLNPAKLAWKSHYSSALVLRALQSFLLGWEYHGARLPDVWWPAAGGGEPAQAEEIKLGWVGQPSSSHILHPMPHPYRKPHTCPALCCSQELPHKLGPFQKLRL